MKLAIINDTHNGVRNSSQIFADSEIRFYEEVFFPYLLENNIKRIIHLGDIFDNRRIVNFKSLQQFRIHFLKKLREYGLHMDLILGNHDVYYKNTNELNSPSEFLGHYMNEITIHEKPIVKDYNGFKLALLPWINVENYDKSIQFIEKCKADWLGGHLELRGFEVLKGVPAHGGMDPALFERFEQVISGHFHTASEQRNIRYLGSQLEFTWSDAHDPKHFHVIDTETREIEAIRNPNTLFNRIYYDATKDIDYSKYDVSDCDNKFVKVVVINKGGDLFTFDKFLDRIQARPIHDLKIAENFSEFIGESVESASVKLENTEVLLDTYVDAVDTQLNKTRLKQEFRNLHIEAQSMELV